MMRLPVLQAKSGRGQNRSRGRSAGRGGASWWGLRPYVLGSLVFLSILFILICSPWVFRNGIFVMNKTFVLRHLDIEGGETLTSDLVRELLGRGGEPLVEGMPLFAVDIARKQNDFLQRAPNIKNIRITRLMPDTLVVRIVERRPLVRIEPGSGLVADSEGAIFVRYRGTAGLPMLAGLEGIDTSLGSRLSGMSMAAVFLIELLEHQRFRIPIVTADAAHPDFVLLTLVDQKQVAIAWDGMLEPGGGSTENLRRKLAELSRAMNTAGGRSRRFWNATVTGRIAAE